MVEAVDATGLAPPCPSISVVMPALNEAANLPHVFARLPADLFEVILVDGGSIDDTVAVARAVCPDVRVIVEPRPGKGVALAAGFDASRGEIIVMLDADGSTDPAEIPAFVDALMGGADFAKGSRFARGGASDDLTLVRRLGNRALSTTVNALFGTRYTDLCYGYNAFWARHLVRLRLDCDGFEVETLLNIRAAQAGLQVVEVPSYEYERLYGVSKLRAWRDGRRVLRTIVRERMRRRRPGPAREELAPDGAVSAT
jgi:glycosyltransferase involved in cell wall biosynthesis